MRFYYGVVRLRCFACSSQTLASLAREISAVQLLLGFLPFYTKSHPIARMALLLFLCSCARLRVLVANASLANARDFCGTVVPRSLAGVYSHSIVAGGLEVMSYSTRLMPCTSLTIRTEIFSSTSQGIRAQSDVIPSIDVTARIPIA